MNWTVGNCSVLGHAKISWVKDLYLNRDKAAVMRLVFCRSHTWQAVRVLDGLSFFVLYRVEVADLTLVVIDSTQLPQEPQMVPRFLNDYLNNVLPKEMEQDHMQQCLLILNKSDLLPNEHISIIQRVLSDAFTGASVSILSCTTREGLVDFLKLLQERVKTM